MSARLEPTVMIVAFWSAASGYDVESAVVGLEPRLPAFRLSSKAEPRLRELVGDDDFAIAPGAPRA